MKTITPIEFQNLLAAQPDLPLLDVRMPVEFAEAHVPQARNMPLSTLQPDALAFPKDQPVYVICHSGQRAHKAAEKLLQKGFHHPVVIAGGTQAWIESNLVVMRSQRKAISIERQVRIIAGTLVLAGILMGWLVRREFFGLSAFVGAGLVFAGVTDFCSMGLLLGKLPWNRKL